MSVDLLVHLLEKNYSSHPRDRLTPEQLVFLKSQKQILGDQVFTDLSNKARNTRQQLQKLSLPEQEQYIQQQDNKFKQELSIHFPVYSPQKTFKSLTQNTVQTTSSSDIHLQEENDRLHSQLAKLKQKLSESEEQTMRLQVQVRQQNEKLTSYDSLFSQLQNSFKVKVNVETDMEQKEALVDFLCKTQTKYSQKQLGAIRESARSVRTSIFQLQQYLKTSPKVDFDAVFSPVQRLLQRIASEVRYSVKYSVIGRKPLNPLIRHVTQIQRGDLSRQNFTPNKNTFLYLLDYALKTNSKLQYLSFLNEQFNDKLNGQVVVQTPTQANTLELKQNEVEKFTEFVRIKLDVCDCVLFENTCLIYYEGVEYERVCRRLGLCGGDIGVFVADEDEIVGR
ncbi:Conserved_hypothetical protein [Hexamita inflata]|uniref:Uncharacterized protein n=1 Tax=Hexamita inflata TaxID=28002 RepID=A0AA86QYH5_9EUKA|nr:Conserved hypothetical protein [Hexamita inflata]